MLFKLNLLLSLLVFCRPRLSFLNVITCSWTSSIFLYRSILRLADILLFVILLPLSPNSTSGKARVFVLGHWGHHHQGGFVILNSKNANVSCSLWPPMLVCLLPHSVTDALKLPHIITAPLVCASAATLSNITGIPLLSKGFLKLSQF